MKKVTRELIKLRQKYVANPKAIQHISSVSKIGGGELNQCYQNAFKYKAPEAFGGSMMSGWLVQPYDPVTNSTAIIQHWWNVDRNDNHIDTTPTLNIDSDYVQDLGIYVFCFTNDARLDTHLGKSMMFKDGRFSVLYDVDNMYFSPLQDLDISRFYTLR